MQNGILQDNLAVDFDWTFFFAWVNVTGVAKVTPVYRSVRFEKPWMIVIKYENDSGFQQRRQFGDGAHTQSATEPTRHGRVVRDGTGGVHPSNEEKVNQSLPFWTITGHSSIVALPLVRLSPNRARAYVVYVVHQQVASMLVAVNSCDALAYNKRLVGVTWMIWPSQARTSLVLSKNLLYTMMSLKLGKAKSLK